MNDLFYFKLRWKFHINSNVCFIKSERRAAWSGSGQKSKGVGCQLTSDYARSKCFKVRTIFSGSACLSLSFNVSRHWVSKHFQDFELDDGLRSQTIAFLDEITCSPNLLPSEHRAASQLLRLLCREEFEDTKKALEILLEPTPVNILANQPQIIFWQLIIFAVSKQGKHWNFIGSGNSWTNDVLRSSNLLRDS